MLAYPRICASTHPCVAPYGPSGAREVHMVRHAAPHAPPPPSPPKPSQPQPQRDERELLAELARQLGGRIAELGAAFARLDEERTGLLNLDDALAAIRVRPCVSFTLPVLFRPCFSCRL
jgi:hypothetical protein